MDDESRILDEATWLEVRANLFPAARPAVEPHARFLWHCDRYGKCDTYKTHSSQALAIDVFGTIKQSDRRDQILSRLAFEFGLPDEGPWQLDLEWRDPENLLCEPHRTQVDARAASSEAVIFFEVKFTERNGGFCSQTQKLRQGPHRGMRQCNRRYELQINPANGIEAICALTAKGIGYWEVIPQLFDASVLTENLPCPFAGPRYQWMRNLTVSWAVAHSQALKPAFVVAYVDSPGLAMAEVVQSRDWNEFAGSLRPGAMTLASISIQRIIQLAQQMADNGCKLPAPQDRSSFLWSDLDAWVQNKVAAACGRSLK